MSNEQRILDALQARNGLDDDELSLRTGVRPRQQVNQICRRLEAEGMLTRDALGGKIVNRLIGIGGAPAAPVVSRRPPASLRPARHSLETSIQSDPEQTLFIVPCSASKRPRGLPQLAGPSVLDSLPRELADELLGARKAVAPRAGLDERLLRPAFERYQGYFYGVAGSRIGEARRRGIHVLIISGGYGILLADEPVGTYEARFSSSWWPRGLLGRVLANYARHHELAHVRAFVAASTSYRQTLTQVDWRQVGVEDALIISPTVEGGGAMVKSPRSQGEAFCAALDGRLGCGWRSSDDLTLEVMQLSVC